MILVVSDQHEPSDNSQCALSLDYGNILVTSPNKYMGWKLKYYGRM